MINILLVNHKISKFCGIYSHGVRMWNILKNSKKYSFLYVEANSIIDLEEKILKHNPRIIIYNYTVGLMGWCYQVVKSNKNIIHIGLGHDVTQGLIDCGNVDFFNFRVALDPTLSEGNNWFTTVRPLFNYNNKPKQRAACNIKVGTFGFYFEHKKFYETLMLIVNNIRSAEINFHITEATFSNYTTKDNFKRFLKDVKCIEYDGKINITTEYITDIEQINFLSNNDINLFFYDYNNGSGPSSAIDYAVAAGRPILINKSYQFRHVVGKIPTIPEYDIFSALELGNSNILKLQEEWSEENFLKDYERIIDEVQNRQK